MTRKKTVSFGKETQRDNVKMNTELNKTRASNFELLRLVSMFFIICHHFIIHGLKTIYAPNLTFWGVTLNTFLVIGVNCFILISGYFGIRASFKGFFRLYLMCAFYVLLIDVFFAVQSGFLLEKMDIKGVLLPFSHARYWFVKEYFYLFLLSPFLNKICDNCDKKTFTGLLLISVVLTFYFGHFWGGAINYAGNNFMNFVFLYLVGRFIALHTSGVKSAKRKWSALTIYALSSLTIIGMVFAMVRAGNPHYEKWGFYYNSPLVTVSAVAFFLFFHQLKIQSKWINRAAASALAIYLIHDNPAVRQYLSDYVFSLGEQQISNSFVLGAVFLLLAAGIFLFCILFDRIRLLITNPIEKQLNRIPFNNYIDKFIDKISVLIK